MATIQNPQELINNQLDLLYQRIKRDVEKAISAPSPENPFESVKAIREKTYLQVQETLAALQKILDKGLHIIVDTLTEQRKDKEKEAILSWFESNIEKIVSVINEESADDRPLSEKLNFPDGCFEAMFNVAQYLYSNHRYDEALSAIVVCLQLNSTLSPLWFIYGCVLQNKEEQEAALYAFEIASMFDEENPYIFANAARSWIALGNWTKADECIEQTLSFCKDNPEYPDLVNYCNELKSWSANYKKQAK